MQHKVYENIFFFKTLSLQLFSFFKYLPYWQCPISRICPDTIHIEEGHFLNIYISSF